MNLGFEEPYRVGKCVGEFLGKHPKLRFAMKVSFFYVVSIALAAQAFAALPAFSQGLDEIQVTVELQNENLVSLFRKIEGQTKLMFAYQRDQIDSTKTFTLPKSTRSVKELLDIAFQGTSFRYRQSLYSVIIYQEQTEQYTPLVTVSGTVKDKEGAPMPAVNIVVKGTTTGTSTDSEGRYEIQAEENDVLVFSFIGFKTQEQQVGARILIDVVLEEDITSLGEVTINGGYYETTDKLKTGSIVKVTAKDIQNQPVTSPLLALQGRVPGLDITPQSGVPGNAPTIRIRGNNSLREKSVLTNASENVNAPLYVVDGVPLSSVPIYGAPNGNFNANGYDPLSMINADDIVSIEVLKDGDATAIYGSRGANGVILITTRNSSLKPEQTNIALKVYRGFGQVSRKLDLMNTRQYVSMRKEALDNDDLPLTDADAYDLTKWDTTRYTDWQKVLLGGNADILDVSGSLSAGNKNLSSSFGGAYHKESLVTPGDFGFKRITGNVALNHTSSNQRFRASTAASYGVGISELPSSNLVGAALTLPPNAPALYKPNGDLNWEVIQLNGMPRATWDNPMAGILGTSKATNKTLIASGNLSYQLMDYATISVSTGFTDFFGEDNSRYPIAAQRPYQSLMFGSASFAKNRRTTWIVEPKISGNRNFGKHKVDGILGTTWQQVNSSSDRIDGSEYTSDALLGSANGAGRTSIHETTSDYKFTSIYGRLGYNYSDKYLINLTARRDGSSRFGEKNRFGNFGSLGMGWIFSNEEFIKKNPSFLSFGKLRASYGITGSDGIGDYGFYSLYRVLKEKYQIGPGLVPDALYNDQFAWEETRKLEAAIELSFFENRVSTEVNWYRNRSSNQLVAYPLPATTGFTSVFQNFNATVQNTGFEILVRGEVLSVSDWRWSASFNISLPDNKLIAFDNIESSPYANVYQVGQPLSVQFLYTYKGINPATGLHEVVDRNEDGIISDLDKTLLNPTDKSVYGGLMNTIEFKRIEFSFLFQFTKARAQKYLPSFPGSLLVNQPVTVLDRWRNAEDVTTTQRFATYAGSPMAATAYGQMLSSDFNFTDASFIRLKTVSLSYRLPTSLLEKVKLKSANVFVQGQNLLTLTRYKGLDPETGGSSLPPLRMLTIGLQITL